MKLSVHRVKVRTARAVYGVLFPRGSYLQAPSRIMLLQYWVGEGICFKQLGKACNYVGKARDSQQVYQLFNTFQAPVIHHDNVQVFQFCCLYGFRFCSEPLLLQGERYRNGKDFVFHVLVAMYLPMP